ncbi:MAG: peptide ABC transporter permease, partial [Candidatus Omnitrophica bacterium CG1_02_49_10]
GFVSVGIATLIGVCLGSLAGYYGGKADTVISRFTDMMLCFPTIFLILAVISVIGPNIYNIMIIIGMTGWMGTARLIRAEILSLKKREFIEAARAVGASNFRIVTKHLIPNAISPVIVSATLGVAAAILVESSLSFLGLGVQPPTPSWGNMLADGKSVLGVGWWLMLFPGLSILITVLGYNLLGEGIRDLTRSRSK